MGASGKTLLLAELLFNAYNAAGPNPGKTHDGKDVPLFSALGEQVTAKWCAVAEKVLSMRTPTELLQTAIKLVESIDAHTRTEERRKSSNLLPLLTPETVSKLAELAKQEMNAAAQLYIGKR